jgi:hypothetical protein
MTGRLSFEKNDQSLEPLVEKTDILYVAARGIIRCRKKIETPVDQHNIPRRVELMRQVLDTVETAHIWTGGYDVHHAAWPRSNYRDIMSEDDEYIGSAYRSASSLRVRLPRQLHNYVHLVSEPPDPPEYDILAQYAREHGDANRLYDTVKLLSFKDFPELDALPFERQEQLRQDSLRRKIENLDEGELGVMPPLELLSSVATPEARQILRPIARPHGLSNSRRARARFFAAA